MYKPQIADFPCALANKKHLPSQAQYNVGEHAELIVAIYIGAYMVNRTESKSMV